VPFIPLIEVVGKGASVSPAQMAGTGAKVGVMTGSIITVAVAVAPGHPLAPATV
jgi:hypothetical protein